MWESQQNVHATRLLRKCFQAQKLIALEQGEFSVNDLSIGNSMQDHHMTIRVLSDASSAHRAPERSVTSATNHPVDSQGSV